MAKSKLKAVDPKSADPSKPKMLIFGKPGVGKTWGALEFPAVYYVDTEGGADMAHYTDKLKKAGGMYFGPEQGSLSFSSILEQVEALATEKHQFRTLVLDSVSKLMNLEIAHEAERLGDKNQFGADKKPAVGYMRRLTAWLTRLDMNVIMIAHQRDLWGLDAKGQRAQIGITFDAWDKLEYELHLCLNIVKAGDQRLAKVVKSRLLGFPDASTFPWSYDEFATRYGRDVIEKESVQLVLISAEQLAEIVGLLEVVKLPDGQVEKWLTAAGVTELKELDTDKAVKIIGHLKGKLPA